MDAAFTVSVDTIVKELEKLASAVDKVSVSEQSKDFKGPAVHAAMKSSSLW